MNLPAEILNPRIRRGPFRAVLFDFDGTLSLIREGWSRVMVGMMVDHLRDRGLVREPDAELWQLVEAFVMALNGHPTLRQMDRFAQEITTRGGTADEPRVYLRMYHERLMAVVQGRWDAIAAGTATVAEWAVPGTHAILRNLRNRGVPVFVASGTDSAHVTHEARLLELVPFFGDRFHAPKDNDPTFTKAAAMARILADLGIGGADLLGFGDGMVETAAVKAVDGVAVGVASAEPGRSGVNLWKRDQLIAAGADAIIPDYTEQQALLAWLFGEE